LNLPSPDPTNKVSFNKVKDKTPLLLIGIAALNTKLGILKIQISPAVVPAYMYSPLGSTIAFVYVLIKPELGN